MKVAIIGAGIAGLSTAWGLVRRGHEVVLLEQGPIPNPLAASGDHHRIIRRAYGKATGYGRLISQAYTAWDALWADLGATHLDPRGFLCISREPGDEAEQYRDGLAAGGYPFELLSRPVASARCAFLDPAGFRYAVFSREGGALHCRAIARDLASWLRKRGADLREHARVASVDVEAGRLMLANGEQIVADRVVVAAGAWVPKLFPDIRSSLTTYRTAVVYLDPPADLQEAWDAAPVILDVGGKTDGYVIPPTGGAGLKFGSGLHKHRKPDADAERTAAPGEGEAIRNLFAPPFSRIADYSIRDVVTCAYIFTADETFHGEARGRALIVSACSGHGYKFGAAVGLKVAETVDTGDVAGMARWLRAEAA